MKEFLSRINASFHKEKGLSLVERGFVIALCVGGISALIAYANYASYTVCPT